MLSHRRRARLLSNSSSSGGGGGGTAGSLMYSTCRRESVSYRPVFRMHIQSARSTLTSSNHSSPIHPSLPHAPSTKSATFAPHVVQLWSKLPEEVLSASSASAFISRLNSMHVSFFNVLFRCSVFFPIYLSFLDSCKCSLSFSVQSRYVISQLGQLDLASLLGR